MAKNKAETKALVTSARAEKQVTKQAKKTLTEKLVESVSSGSKYTSLSVEDRAELTLVFGLAYDDCNSYVADRGRVLTAALNESREVSQDVKFFFLAGEKDVETGFYIAKGKGGLQAGRCARLDCGEYGTWLQHTSGNVIRSDAFEGLSFVTRAEIRELAMKKTDLRKFKTIDRETGKETFHVGAVLGNMGEKRQALIEISLQHGLDSHCLTTGKIAKSEKADLSVEVGTLNDAEKETVKAQLFSGSDIHKGKQIARNSVRKARRIAIGS